MKILLLLIALTIAACTTIPPGYDRDTTPGNDGSDWIGGAP